MFDVQIFDALCFIYAYEFDARYLKNNKKKK